MLVCGIYTYEITKPNREEILFVENLGDIEIFCRYHTLIYEVELKGINEIKSKITASIELLTQICENVKFNHICLFTMTEMKALYAQLNDQNKIIKVSKIQSQNQKIPEILSVMEKTVVLADTTYISLKQGIMEMQSIINFLGKHQNKLQDQLDYTNFESLAQLTQEI